MNATHFLFRIPGSDDFWDLDQIEKMPEKPDSLLVYENLHNSFKPLGRITPVIALMKFR